MYTAEELSYQLKTTKTSVLIVHVFSVALDAACGVGLPKERIILIDSMPNSHHSYLEELIRFGLKEKPQYTELRLECG